jgi:hypothetical protein
LRSAGQRKEDERCYEVVYREAVRALDLQRGALDALRTRAGILLSAGAVATSVIGATSLANGVSPWDWLATGLFLLFGGLIARILWPRAEGAEGFTVSARSAVRYLESEQAPGLATLYRDLALYAERELDANRRRHLDPLTRAFRAATLAMVADMAAWAVALVAD